MLDCDSQVELPVISIGVSANGLDTCRAMLKALSGNVQAAFVLIQHIDTPQDVKMVDLLAPHTELKVVQAFEGMLLQPGWLHVIPPDVCLTVAQRRVHFSRRDAEMAVAAMEAGASDFPEKPARAVELLATVRRAIKANGAVQPKEIRQEIALERVSCLTAREREILALVLDGAPSKNIAADLGIAQRTVENHRASIMRKTGARSLPELVRIALATEAE